MISDTLKAMFHQPWQVLDWWVQGLPRGDKNALCVEGDSCFVLRDVLWGQGTSLETFLKAGTEWAGFPKMAVKDLRAILPEDVDVIFTQEKGYDLRAADSHIEIDLKGSELMVLKAPVMWITGIHEQKGCLYLTLSGNVSPEPVGAFWTSYHAYPHGEGILSTRVRNVRHILYEGVKQEFEDRGDGVYYIENVRSGLARFDAETF